MFLLTLEYRLCSDFQSCLLRRMAHIWKWERQRDAYRILLRELVSRQNRGMEDKSN